MMERVVIWRPQVTGLGVCYKPLTKLIVSWVLWLVGKKFDPISGSEFFLWHFEAALANWLLHGFCADKWKSFAQLGSLGLQS